ncbi:peptidase inhibitor family I36 protein [Actinomadura barringtoniae]|uniref:Peptidase inhibitor family I36 protein n=1 Tax=Actinomadura barringtoniae TaxID=1427535 RepID=A0A939PQX0_9ACTN|nr:peptidase inhibitor family I36 protein [Actinomadura barringtoniae]MBO2453514.1 peptidase inhibitor family I36 protein [Actinomadura barringtoniae]
MKTLPRILTAATAVMAIGGSVFASTAAPASAAARNGKCDSGEFCLYYNSGLKGSLSDFTSSVGDYGTKQPKCYDFKSKGAGKGMCVKNHAASAWNRSKKTVRVYYNSNFGGRYQDIKAGAKANLNSTLKNNNASHQIGPGSTAGCSTSGTGDRRSCAQAVAWAKSHITRTYHKDYANRCDHVVGLAYGFSASGSTSAYRHWLAVPSRFKHPGSTNVPAGGLAFFSGGYGHVMISIGGGKFVSNDINGRGTLTVTTISAIRSKWGKPYLGWTQPWFQANH